MNSPLIICPQCNGSGYIQSVACPTCKNDPASMHLSLENVLLYFNFRSFSLFSIAKRRAIIRVEFIINFVLYLAATVGILFLSFHIYKGLVSSNAGLPAVFFQASFWDVHSIFLRVFFITLLTDLYLFYRLSRAEELHVRVVKKTYQKNETPAIPSTKKVFRDMTPAFSSDALATLEEAYQLAAHNHFHEVTPLHLLACLMGGRSQESSVILMRLGVNAGVLYGKIKRGLETVLTQEAQEKKIHKNINFAPAFQEVVLKAYQEAYSRGGGGKVEVRDVWIPLAEVQSYAQEILYDLDIEDYKIRHVAIWLEIEKEIGEKRKTRLSRSFFKSKHGMNRAMTAVQTRTLNAFSYDLTVMSREGRLPPSLGHRQKIDEIFTLLQSGARGVILVGNPGIGKESLIEEIAQLMAAELVPEVLEDKRLVSLSLAAILAGGDPLHAAERLYKALQEAAYSGNCVLFIKDIHTLVGIGLHGEAGSETMGMDHILSQVLEMSSVILFATTDFKNYAKHIENSPLHEACTRVDIPEPETQEAVLMLEARVPYIEAKHHVFFTYQSLEKAVELSNRLIHTEYQPEKALKLLQEVAAYVEKERGRKSFVKESDVAAVLSSKIQMPLAQITSDEKEKLLHLEEEIHKRYINQEYAVSQVAAALRRARAEIRDEKRPIANFLFIGPTGVGKTELAKRIALIFFNSQRDMIRLDMSEFQEIENIERLLGSAKTPGLLTEGVRANPYSILLLDELEKAHKNILNVFLQIMDEGRVTSDEGELIDCTNLIIVATSNAGTALCQEKLEQGVPLEVIKEKFIKHDLLQYFNPEFLNRFDDIILFKPLSLEHIKAIAELILSDIQENLAHKGISFEVTHEALLELASAGYDPLYGARPLRRAIQDHVQNALANFLISGKIGRRDVVVLEAGGELTIKKAAPL